jgi:hypothetical protein
MLPTISEVPSFPGPAPAVHGAALGLVGDVVVELAFDAEEHLPAADVAGLVVADPALALHVLVDIVDQQAPAHLELDVVVGPLRRAPPGDGGVLSLRGRAEAEREQDAHASPAEQRGLVVHCADPSIIPCAEGWRWRGLNRRA